MGRLHRRDRDRVNDAGDKRLAQRALRAARRVGCRSSGRTSSLAVRKQRPMWMLRVLIIANAAWAVLCAVFAARMVGGDSVFAAMHFLSEGIYVGSLASIEWNRREKLAAGE